ncbi:ATP synthase F1 subunit delta [Geotoga petraea]|uniref:ATP synthase subunit delta n=1 Tax=Geotoga petraea TaxID=28234 RepID=A0A1G6N0A2_9BACT|nr:ATP synthase F1 subunit delta [Geotoga petraea]TGG87283.1 ATP synthase F1 subunit delta [Geotoga petraea]SDC61121.1 ATP synthase F1 subcomplex delta subunit [Geotoga petraea]
MRNSYSVAKRYSDALINLLSENKKLNELDTYISNLQNIISEMNENQVFYDLINSPLLPDDLITKKIVEKANTEDEVFKKFLNFIVIKKRQNLLPLVSKLLINFSYELKNIVLVDLISAKELEESTIDTIKNNLKSKTGRNVNLDLTIDESLIGGIQIYLDDKLFDYSVKGYLNSVKEIYAVNGGD